MAADLDDERAAQPVPGSGAGEPPRSASPGSDSGNTVVDSDGNTVVDSDPAHDDDNDDEEKALPRPRAGPAPVLPAGPVSPSGAEDVGAFLASRPVSRASSARSRPLTVVPRARRRGLFGRFTVVPEVERPYDYEDSTKWGITATIAFATIAAPLGSSIFYPALPSLSEELHAPATVTNLAVAMYMLAMSIFPLWWSSFSEQFGRRSIYLISFSLFIIFSVVCAVSTNISMLVVFRVLTGGASASVQAVGAGTIADIWESRDRGRAMGAFYLGPLLGPLIAPIVGGALAQGFGWRASMYFLALYGAVILVLLFFLLPETLARRPRDEPEPVPVPVLDPAPLSRVATAASARAGTKRLARGLRRVVVDPLAVLLFLRFPPVLITVLLAAIAFGALFIANISIQQKFAEPPYGFKPLIVGLLYIPLGLGYLTASFFGGAWVDKILVREAKRANRYDEHGKLILLPEDRMRENAWLANIMYPLGLLLFGWTLRYGVLWIVPSIGGFIFGVSSMLVFATVTTMLTEFVRKRSSAGVAVNNFVRNILSCVGTIVAAPWINAVGTGWVFTAVGLFCLVVGCLSIWVLRRNARRWRKDMDEALKGM